LLSRCLFSITEQAADSVEIVVVEGTGQLGDKVNAAVYAARGDYFTVVDDDDYLTGAYLAEVLPHCQAGVDYVGFVLAEMSDGRFSALCRTSGESKSWDGQFRWPIPKGVIRTEIARKVTFGNEYTADRAWSREVCRHVESWAYIDRVLYVYDFFKSTSVYIGAGIPRDVGCWPYSESQVRRIVVDR
jgi:hypothetical protein